MDFLITQTDEEICLISDATQDFTVIIAENKFLYMY